MLAHRHDAGGLHSHPLTTQNQAIDEDSSLWFFISKKSEMAKRLASDGEVNLSYADPGKDSYVSISGNAVLSNDRATIQRLWNKKAEAWFPGGIDDPDLQLLEVRIDEAEYWDVKVSKMTQLYKMAKAAVTGKPPKDMTEHKEIQVS
jgi:general stress protein 26